MNGFLVVMRFNCDDIPLLLTSDEDEAMRFAEAVTEDDAKQAIQVLDLEVTMPPACVCVWAFTSGTLIRNRKVKEWN
jgi:hypothetical protein